MTDDGAAALLIDGEYLRRGMKKAGVKYKDYSPASVAESITSALGFSFEVKHIFSASDGRVDTTSKRKTVQLFSEGWAMHVHGLKTLEVVCRKQDCGCCHSRETNPIFRHVQAGVDVAITVQIMACCIEEKFSSIVILAGDGDFLPAIDWVLANKPKVQVFIVGFEESMSPDLTSIVGPGKILYLEDTILDTHDGYDDRVNDYILAFSPPGDYSKEKNNKCSDLNTQERDGYVDINISSNKAERFQRDAPSPTYSPTNQLSSTESVNSPKNIECNNNQDSENENFEESEDSGVITNNNIRNSTMNSNSSIGLGNDVIVPTRSLMIPPSLLRRKKKKTKRKTKIC